MIHASPLNFLLKPHRYMRSFHFVHHTPNGNIPFSFSPCAWCDFTTIQLAKNVRKLHLDFGDSYHCIMGYIEQICRLAIEEMHHLELLVLTLSNLRCFHSEGYAAILINKINEATRETGRLLSVGTKAFSTGPDEEGFASESWFWQSTEGRGHLCWVDDWAKQIAENEAAAEALFGKRRLTTAPTATAPAPTAPITTALTTTAPTTSAATPLAATTTPSNTTAPATITPATVEPATLAAGTDADATEDASSELDFDDEMDFDDELDFDDSDLDGDGFDDFMPTPQ